MRKLQQSMETDTFNQDPHLAWARRHVAGAASLGLDPEALLGDSFIRLNSSAPGSTSITPNQFGLLCINLIRGLEDEFQGAARRSLPMGAVAMGVRVMLGADCLGDGLNSLLRYFEVLSPVYRSRLDVRSDRVSLALEVEGRGDTACLPGEEILIAAVHMYMSWFVGRTVPLFEATTRSPDHPGLCSNRGVFLACPTRLSNRVSIQFERSCLAWPRQATDRDHPVRSSVQFAINRVWNGSVSDAEARRVRGHAVSRLVADLLEAVPGITFNEVAEQVHMSPVTLWRRLRAEGVNFQQLRRGWLGRRAVELLRTTDMSVERLACELGFADARSLRHAVKAVTGRTPQEIRINGIPPPENQGPEADPVIARMLELCDLLDA